jgi:hypothetical protein
MLNRKALYTVGAAFLLALLIGILIGRMTAPSNVEGSGVDTTLSPVTTLASASQGVAPADQPAIGTESDDVPTYGTEGDRTALTDAATSVGITGFFSDTTALLAGADRVYFDLERLDAQDRSPAYATTVVWNESLASLDSTDLAGFATMFSLATTHLCPQHDEYGEDVAYILGI